jgi:DNA-binding LytR/AlgR family response regulator
LQGETHAFYGRISDIEQQLNNQDFISIHKSHLINYDPVIEYQYDYVVTTQAFQTDPVPW